MVLGAEVRKYKMRGKLYIFFNHEDQEKCKSLCALLFPGTFQNCFAEIIFG